MNIFGFNKTLLYFTISSERNLATLIEPFINLFFPKPPLPAKFFARGESAFGGRKSGDFTFTAKPANGVRMASERPRRRYLKISSFS